jgi:hypothetical protein
MICDFTARISGLRNLWQLGEKILHLRKEGFGDIQMGVTAGCLGDVLCLMQGSG